LSGDDHFEAVARKALGAQALQTQRKLLEIIIVWMTTDTSGVDALRKDHPVNFAGINRIGAYINRCSCGSVALFRLRTDLTATEYLHRARMQLRLNPGRPGISSLLAAAAEGILLSETHLDGPDSQHTAVELHLMEARAD
jgi:hypothetical protein